MLVKLFPASRCLTGNVSTHPWLDWCQSLSVKKTPEIQWITSKTSHKDHNVFNISICLCRIAHRSVWCTFTSLFHCIATSPVVHWPEEEVMPAVTNYLIAFNVTTCSLIMLSEPKVHWQLSVRMWVLKSTNCNFDEFLRLNVKHQNSKDDDFVANLAISSNLS